MEKHEFEQEVFSTGKWNGDDYTDADLDDMVTNFTELSEIVKPPVKLGHDTSKWKDGLPALGWITGLRKEGSKLIAKFSDVPEIVYKAIKNKLYKRVSSEIYWNYKHAGKVFKRVFAGLALLGADTPAVTNLKDLEVFLSQNLDPGSFEKVCSYTEDDFNNSKKGGPNMDTAQIKVYEDQIAAEKKARETAEAEAKANAVKLAKFEAAEAARKTAEAETKKANSKTEFNAFLDAEVKAFRMTPACAEILKKDGAHVYTDDSGITITLATLKEYQAKVTPILDKKEFGEQGEGHNDNNKDVQAEMNSKVAAYMTDKKVSYVDALTAVMDANPELADRYVSDIPKGGE
jgi:hypothetical protein